MFLTEDELKELTGYQRPKQISRWLAEHGYRFEQDRAGWPKVLKESVYARLSASFKTEPRLNLA